MRKCYMKTTLALFIFLILATVTWAQESPAATAQNTVDGITITIDYHSPQVKGRAIWGDLLSYDEVWRTGANNATTLEVTGNMKIGKNKIPKGKYALFTIPKKGDSWTVIINNEPDQWGAFNYKESEDLCRFEVKVDRTLELQESLEFDVKDDGTVVFTWEYRTFSFKLSK